MPSRSAWRPILAGLLLLTGLSKPAVAFGASPSAVPPNRARVYVIQGPTQGVGSLVVYVNRLFVENIRPNTYFTFVISPGKHEISIASNTRATLSLPVKAGATYYVSHRINKDGKADLRVISAAAARPLLAQYRPLRSDRATDKRPPKAKAPDKPAPAETKPPETPTPIPRPAGESNWYIGATAGIASAKDAAPCSQFSGMLAGGFTCRFKENSGAFGLFGGYRIDRNFAVEAGYLDLGEFTAEVDTTSTSVSNKVTVNGIVGDVVATVPVAGDLGLSARAGIFRWSVDDTFVLNGVSDSSSKSGTGLHVGLGVSLKLGKRMEIRGAYEKFKKVGEEGVTGQSDVDLLAGSLVYYLR